MHRPAGLSCGSDVILLGAFAKPLMLSTVTHSGPAGLSPGTDVILPWCLWRCTEWQEQCKHQRHRASITSVAVFTGSLPMMSCKWITVTVVVSWFGVCLDTPLGARMTLGVPGVRGRIQNVLNNDGWQLQSKSGCVAVRASPCRASTSAAWSGSGGRCGCAAPTCLPGHSWDMSL